MLPEENLKGRLSAFKDCRGIVDDDRVQAILDARISELEMVLGGTDFPAPAPRRASAGSVRRAKERAPKKERSRADVFIANHLELTNKELARALGVTKREIIKRKRELGLRKKRMP